MAKVKHVITAYKAQMNPQVNGVIDIFGEFDNLIQPMFPFPMANLSVVVTVTDLQRPTMFEVRLNAPDDTLITKGEFGILPDPFGVGKKILDLEKFLVGERGKYTIDIFEKVAQDKVKFLSTEDLFIADYPPQRRLSDEDKAKILATEGVIKTVRTEFKAGEEVIKLQVNLDKNVPIDEGHIAIPENDRLTVGDRVFDLTGIRRQIEWLFGNPLPKAPEKKEENEKQMKEYQSKLVLAMAHDLRTPLTSLITFLEIAIKKSTNNENQEYIQKSYQKANQIRELTDQLFDFFLIQKQEKIELDPPANVEYALGEYLSEFCAFVEAEGYQVIVKNMEWGEAKVQVYHRYIGRIMDNLVSNIKKYADKEYPIILEMKNNENMIQIDFENQKNTKKEYVKGTGIGIQNIKNMIIVKITS